MPAKDGPRQPESGPGEITGNEAIAEVVKSALARVAGAAKGTETAASPQFISSLCTLLVERDIDAAEALLRSRVAKRQRAPDLVDAILGDCARELGVRWDSDRISFADVAIGITELHRLHKRVVQRHVPMTRQVDTPYAVFATLPRQSHTFGIILAAEAFRREGWHVDLQLEIQPKELVDRVRRLRPDAVGLTAGRIDTLQSVRFVISQIQKLPFRVPILLGGGGATALRDSLTRPDTVRVVEDVESALKAAQAGF